MFSCFDGFQEVRLARDKNRQRIAFVDYDQDSAATYAMNSTRGFRFQNSTKGITVRFSENTKNNAPQGGGGASKGRDGPDRRHLPNQRPRDFNQYGGSQYGGSGGIRPPQGGYQPRPGAPMPPPMYGGNSMPMH